MVESDLSRDHLDTIREVFVYAERFRGMSFVVKLDSGLLEGDETPGLIADIAVLRRAGIHVLIVPGAARRIDTVLKHYNMPIDRVDGRRVSPTDAIALIQMAAFDVANRIMTQLSAANVHAAVGNWVRARGVGVDAGVDFGHTGIVERVHREVVEKLLATDVVPIFPCIGWSATGNPYNVSSDELGVAVARAIGAEKLFFVTAGLCRPPSSIAVPDEVSADEGGRISRLTVEQAARMSNLANDAACEDQESVRWIERLNHAITACRAGVSRVHIVNGRTDGVLLREIFSNLGVGMMVHANEYESVRPMHADDIADVLRLMRPFVERGQLLPRTADEVRARLSDFAVSEVDGTVRACCALHDLGDRTGEIAALAVDERFSQLGIGEKLVHYQLSRARARNMRSVVALTTRASDWFEKLGFVHGSLSNLPEARKSRYDEHRRPRVLVHSVGGLQR